MVPALLSQLKCDRECADAYHIIHQEPLRAEYFCVTLVDKTKGIRVERQAIIPFENSVMEREMIVVEV